MPLEYSTVRLYVCSEFNPAKPKYLECHLTKNVAYITAWSREEDQELCTKNDRVIAVLSTVPKREIEGGQKYIVGGSKQSSK